MKKKIFCLGFLFVMLFGLISFCEAQSSDDKPRIRSYSEIETLVLQDSSNEEGHLESEPSPSIFNLFMNEMTTEEEKLYNLAKGISDDSKKANKLDDETLAKVLFFDPKIAKVLDNEDFLRVLKYYKSAQDIDYDPPYDNEEFINKLIEVGIEDISVLNENQKAIKILLKEKFGIEVEPDWRGFMPEFTKIEKIDGNTFLSTKHVSFPLEGFKEATILQDGRLKVKNGAKLMGLVEWSKETGAVDITIGPDQVVNIRESYQCAYRIFGEGKVKAKGRTIVSGEPYSNDGFFISYDNEELDSDGKPLPEIESNGKPKQLSTLSISGKSPIHIFDDVTLPDGGTTSVLSTTLLGTPEEGVFYSVSKNYLGKANNQKKYRDREIFSGTIEKFLPDLYPEDGSVILSVINKDNSKPTPAAIRYNDDSDDCKDIICLDFRKYYEDPKYDVDVFFKNEEPQKVLLDTKDGNPIDKLIVSKVSKGSELSYLNGDVVITPKGASVTPEIMDDKDIKIHYVVQYPGREDAVFAYSKPSAEVIKCDAFGKCKTVKESDYYKQLGPLAKFLKWLERYSWVK